MILKVRSEDALQMLLVEYNDVAKALTTDRADESLHVGRLPGRPISDHDLLDGHMLHALAEELAVDRISVPDHEPRGLVLRKRFDYLLSCPLGRRMRRNVEVDDHAAMMSEHDETKQDAKRCRRYCEEIDGYDIANMVIQESPPRLRRRLSMPNHVLVDGRLGYIVA